MISTQAPVVVCEDLSKRFGRLTVLRSLSLELHAGESLAILGRNGAGKSTLIGIIASLIRSYRGRVRIAGTDIKRGGAEMRRSLGVVSHETMLYSDLTAADNLRLFCNLYGVEDVRARSAQLLKAFEVDSHQNAPVRDLSRGMKQRVAFARAVVHEPEILLLDEPFTGLDESGIRLATEMLTRFRERGGASILVTHSIERAFAVADRIIVLERGAIAHETRIAATRIETFRSEYQRILG